ncbi:MAG: hypothetical protein DME02_08820 [Candidatus Rokuibacteriota bacterium]|nr:MAG: hypothetical protein DME02_08820 [Candidatus Rokubacteria bacterium]
MTLAFTSTEPVIAANHMANAQARAIAESGVERTLWALTKGETDPAANGALIDPLPAPVPAPYDGSQLVNLGVGEFKVTVTNGPAVNERTIEAVGYVPNAAYPIAIKKLETPFGLAARPRSAPRTPEATTATVSRHPPRRTRRGRWQRTAIRPSPVHRAGRR